MRLLIVKMSSFGDVVHTFPALTDLKAARPDVEVDWLVEESFAGLAAAHPAVSAVHPVALRRLRWPPTRWPSLIAHRAGLKHTLHARRYDMVVDLQGLVKSAVMAGLAGRPVIGIDPASAREPASGRFYARKIKLVDHPHAVEKLRHLLADAVGYDVPAGKGRAGILVPDVPLLVPTEYGLVVPSTSWPSKLWGEERWRKLIIDLAGEGRKLIIPWGDEREEERARHLSAGLASAEALSRRLSGTELMRLVGGARFAIGVDTGLMQLAAAFGVPGVTLFGATDPAKTAPYGDNQRIVRSTGAFAPCLQEECTHGPGNERCMDGVGYEAVRAEVEAMLAGLPATAAST